MSFVDPERAHNSPVFAFDEQDLEVQPRTVMCPTREPLLFANDVVFVGLQHALERFAAQCGEAGMRINASKSEAMVFCCKNEDCHRVIFSESRGGLLEDLRYGSDAGLLSVSGRCLTKLLPKPLETQALSAVLCSFINEETLFVYHQTAVVPAIQLSCHVNHHFNVQSVTASQQQLRNEELVWRSG